MKIRRYSEHPVEYIVSRMLIAFERRQATQCASEKLQAARWASAWASAIKIFGRSATR